MLVGGEQGACAFPVFDKNNLYFPGKDLVLQSAAANAGMKADNKE
ncbi:hypothetical protein [Cytobacillus firmus]|nr:hypothetical protein [Cytobacillus firmus]